MTRRECCRSPAPGDTYAELFSDMGSTPIASTKCESGEPPTIYFVGAFFVLTMPLPER
nr:MAG TPA: hypothetical protein [Caudoviricetes sp.]